MDSLLKRVASIVDALRATLIKQGRTLLFAAVLIVNVCFLFGCGDDPVSNGTANYTLQISTNPIGGGTVSRTPDKSTYSAGEQVILKAQPASGYNFVAWSGVSTSTIANITVTMNANLMLTANFSNQSVIPPITTYTLTTIVSPIGGGAILCNPNQTTFSSGTSVTVMATAASGYTFIGWSGASNSTSTSVTVTMNGDLTLTANFKQQSSVGSTKFTFIDSRDGKTYNAVQIGNQAWMAENLNYQVSSGSWCYNNNSANCNICGRLYNWNTAKTVCPSGWHLPTREEWDNLAESVGGQKSTGYYSLWHDWLYAGKTLKSTTGWGNDGNGTDGYGFSALPCGTRSTSGSFESGESCGAWWTATEYNSNDAYMRYMFDILDRDHILESNYGKGGGFSVRCRQN